MQTLFTISLNEEVNCTELSPQLGFPGYSIINENPLSTAVRRLGRRRPSEDDLQTNPEFEFDPEESPRSAAGNSFLTPFCDFLMIK